MFATVYPLTLVRWAPGDAQATALFAALVAGVVLRVVALAGTLARPPQAVPARRGSSTVTRARAARTLVPYLVPLLLIAIEWPLLSPAPALADHFQFWAAGHMVVTGGSPYDRSAWEAAAAYGPIPGGVAVNTVIRNLAQTQAVWLYPPQTAFLFAPFGALPLGVGVALLHAFVLVAAAAALVLAARAMRLAGARLAFGLTLAALSQPFVITVRNGQLTGVVLAGMVLAYLGIRDRRPWLLGLGVALVSVKPHIAIAFGLGALGYLLLKRDWRSLAVATVTLLCVTLPAELRDPFPLAQLTASGGDRLASDLSTICAVARDLGGGAPLAALIASVAVAAALAAVRSARPPSRGAVALAALLVLSLVVAPYAHDYDELLVVPALFAAIAVASGSRAEPAISGLAAAGIALLPWLLFYWWPLLGQGDRHFQGGPLGILPVLVALVLAVATWFTRRTRGTPAASALSSEA